MRPVAHPPTPGWKAEGRATLRLAGPLVLANLLQMLTFAIDVMFIARLGAAELAAAALSFSILGLLVWALHGLTGAAAPIMAAELGARAPALRPVRRVNRMALWMAVLSGSVAMLICANASYFMRLTGQPPAIVALAEPYMAILLWSIIPMLIAGVLRNFAAALGRPGLATLIAALGIVVNGLADYMLVFGNWGAPALGLQGAAIATVATSVAMVLAYIIAIACDPRLARYHIFGFAWRPDWARFAEIWRIGTPIALTVAAEAGVFGAAAFLMGRIGALELAAHTLALQIAALAFQVPYGVGQAATIRVGYFYGARDPVGMGRAGWSGIAMGGGFMVVTASAMLLMPLPLLAIYLDPWDAANAELVAQALTFLTIAAAFQLVDGLQAVAQGSLRGLKDTRVPMWIAIYSYWLPGFGLAAGLGLGTSLAGTGVWLGLAAGLACAASMLMWRWHRREALGLVPQAQS